MKELKAIKRNVPYSLKLKLATELRDYSLLAEDAKSIYGYDYIVDIFNDKDIMRDPDSIGITLFHPNKTSPTHVKTAVYPISIGRVEFSKRVKQLQKEFKIKLKGK